MDEPIPLLDIGDIGFFPKPLFELIMSKKNYIDQHILKYHNRTDIHRCVDIADETALFITSKVITIF